MTGAADARPLELIAVAKQFIRIESITGTKVEKRDVLKKGRDSPKTGRSYEPLFNDLPVPDPAIVWDEGGGRGLSRGASRSPRFCDAA